MFSFRSRMTKITFSPNGDKCFHLTFWIPYQTHSQEILQVVQQGVFDPEGLQGLDRPYTGSSHQQTGAIQSDTGQRVAAWDVSREEVKNSHLLSLAIHWRGRNFLGLHIKKCLCTVFICFQVCNSSHSFLRNIQHCHYFSAIRLMHCSWKNYINAE